MTVRIAIACGDPAGIGPEVALRAAAGFLREGRAEVELFGPGELLKRLSRELKVPPPPVHSTGKGDRWAPSAESGRAALAALEAAVRAVEEGRAGALVTAPVSKAQIEAAGIPFQGHTEYLAARAGVRRVTMLFVADDLVVSLVTRHVPLRRVPHVLTIARVRETIRQTDEALRRYFGTRLPRIGVAGLNPHAGEGGLFGAEEREIIEPAVQEAREQGVACSGPHPGDTLFRRVLSGEFDAGVAMYHDQGLAAVKTAAPGAVNLTVGLPYIRTSPDHGTAFDIAGTGRADPEGMLQAVRLACRLMGH